MMRAKLFLGLIPVLGVQLLLAQIPQTISYQGVLTLSGGPVDGNTDMTFKLWGAATGGTALWTELHLTATANPVVLSEGLFDVILGQTTPLPDPFPSPAWLLIAVTDSVEMTPRIELA
ncbi:MAG: hypothetical protein IIB43_07070, partial [Candidatus Marinimicrobia bacterium]|nr:hypothetical protein [Candidatus Neomarinimicrobiota bacterium]